ncbi:MAG: hypothetical protein ACRDYY_06170 [Acidimicrobiales bacterium]
MSAAVPGDAMPGDAARVPSGPAWRAELSRLVQRHSASRRLLRERVVLFVCLGAGLGALHLAARRSGGDHVALTAMLSALIPVFAPVCFVPAVFSGRERAAAPAVVLTRLGAVVALGATVAAVHLAVWEILAVATGTIGGPTPADVPFMLVVVVVTTAVAATAYQAPRRDVLTQPATVASVVGLYAASFVVHGVLLSPSLAQIRGKLGAGRLTVEVVAVVVSLGVVWLLMRREVREGIRKSTESPPVRSGPQR